jgi:hypothetical protein
MTKQKKLTAKEKLQMVSELQFRLKAIFKKYSHKK